VSTRTGEVMAVPVRGGARDAECAANEHCPTCGFGAEHCLCLDKHLKLSGRTVGGGLPGPFNTAKDAESPHTRENLEAYVRQQEARLKETASPWMKAEVRKGIELAKKELAAMGTVRDIEPVAMGRDVVCRGCGNPLTAVGPGSGLCTACAAARGEPLADPAGRDARRARLHRALDAVMDRVTSRRGLSYDHPRILAIRAKIAALEARGVKYDDPRIQKFEADIRQLEGNR